MIETTYNKALKTALLLVATIILTTNVAEGSINEGFIFWNFASEVNLTGTSLVIERGMPIDYGILGVLRISGDGDGFVDVTVNINGLSRLECHDVPVIWEITRTPKGKEIVTLDISDYTNRIYINIRILKNGKGRVHLSTWTPTATYYVKGEIENPLIFGYVNQRVAVVDDAFFEKNYDATRETRFKVYEKYTGEIISPNRISAAAYYGLVHEVFFDAEQTTPEQIPGWLEQGTWVQYGVYVEAPTEATIKSDLQYYNYYCYYGSPQRILVGYEIDTHGASVDEPDKPLAGADWSWLYPDEVKNLWKKVPGDYQIKPQDTVILADACRSLWDSDENSGGEMAAAWVDYGAAAYVGSTILVPADIDPFLTEFWQSLCFQEETVGNAESDASAVQGLSSTDFQVYGKSDFRIPN